jgi:uncharacterized membrane protein YfcA
MKLVLYAFIGGWVSGALGLGGGAIFNPVMLSMGIPPQVSSATGMYMIMFTTFGSSLTYSIYGLMNYYFALWIGLWCILGSFLGMRLLSYVMKKYNRQSPIVMVLAGILGISALLIPIFGVMDLVDKSSRGEDIFTFNSICK